MSDALTVVLVDDDAELRFVLNKFLSRHGGYEVVGEAATGQQGIQLATELEPDVVVLDLMMPTLSGGEALPTLVKNCPRTMVVILSALEGAANVDGLLSLGAFAYYGKARLESVPDLIATDHALFVEALNGHDTVPPWRWDALSDA